MSAELPELLTVPEAAAKLRVDESFVYRHKLELAGVKVGGSLRIPVPGISAYIAARSAGPRRRSCSPRRSGVTSAQETRLRLIAKGEI